MSTLSKLADSQEEALPSQALTPSVLQVSSHGLTRSLIDGYQVLAGIILAVFWLRSGLAHTTNPYYFLSSIYSYEVVGPVLGVAAATGFPALQLVLAAALVTRRFVGGALFLSSVLLTGFAAAQVSALTRGLEINCGCFGAAAQLRIGGESLATALSLLFFAVTAFVCWSIGQACRPSKVGFSLLVK